MAIPGTPKHAVPSSGAAASATSGFDSELELMPALVPAPFPPHSFYAIWSFVSSPGLDQLPPASPVPLSVCFATACPTPLRTLRPLPDIVDLSFMDV
ncbi:hypothetical protein DPMN_038117 [Dreissena polymorpha]|uniref:Uncharacterized protein n=1 Tax=Dreissena polymorpha TaxID=45954 RepID=A0A9D4MDQ6_DREPO|nr:hypothetical protein DPMN_038117 [Dreissena polymorpha]